jgi:hypothetical protein
MYRDLRKKLLKFYPRYRFSSRKFESKHIKVPNFQSVCYVSFSRKVIFFSNPISNLCLKMSEISEPTFASFTQKLASLEPTEKTVIVELVSHVFKEFFSRLTKWKSS